MKCKLSIVPSRMKILYRAVRIEKQFLKKPVMKIRKHPFVKKLVQNEVSYTIVDSLMQDDPMQCITYYQYVQNIRVRLALEFIIRDTYLHNLLDSTLPHNILLYKILNNVLNIATHLL